ncbi:hypothetical protein V6N12_007289 [Hibiscus sabdariffa]|uniref:Uncharacterized protein n=1 Tax=Hibiscus sabdariffa TaxID=183260 RepID=A0ABR2F1D9_9ROSI
MRGYLKAWLSHRPLPLSKANSCPHVDFINRKISENTKRSLLGYPKLPCPSDQIPCSSKLIYRRGSWGNG